jgi:carbamoyl-phosphate synthase large subunit
MGLAVGTVACASEARWAPSFRSRWTALRAVVPDLAGNGDGFVDAVLALVDRYRPAMILPAHDGSIEALRARRGTIEERTALPLASEAALNAVVNKERALTLAAGLGIGVPCSLPVFDASDVLAAVNELGLPAVVKPGRSWMIDKDGRGTRGSAKLVVTQNEALRVVEEMRGSGGNAIMQSWLPGRREAITVFYAGGRFWARFAQVSYREWPVVGGSSVLCESIPLLADITESTERLVESIGLEGCSMVEYRRDASGRAMLMEINPRMGSSVSLAIASGVDLPGLVHASATGRTLWAISGYRPGRRVRRISDDLRNLKSAFGGGENPDSPRPGRAAGTFLADFVRRPSSVDPPALRDVRPALVVFRKMFADALLKARTLRR